MADNITDWLSDIQQKLKAPKGQTNNFGKYKYRSCEDIVEAVKPLLEKHRLALILSDELVNIGDRYYIKAEAKIIKGDSCIAVYGYAREALDRKGMDVSQITGTASSYARKYALNGLLAIDDTKDADHESVDKEPVVIDEVPDMVKVKKAAEYFKKEIDRDEWENADKIREALGKLNQSEKLALNGLLKDKAPDSNKMYNRLLKEYIDYVPETGVAK